MGSLLIATGILIYSWISGIHFSFLRQRSDDTLNRETSDLIMRALIWPLLHLIPDDSADLGDVLE